MPGSPTGFGNFFLDRNINMPAGYQLLGCPPGMQQASPHMVGMAGMPIPFSGIPGYSFIPYPHPGHMAHISNAYDMKAASSYHQALLSRGGPYYAPYRPMPADDPSRVTKVATRESTSALKAWLSEHLKNPYPTKGEKIMLAIVTKMSLTQVSTWFANARRRLKKENRVSWASKGKSDEEDEEDDGESEEEGSLKKCTEDEDEIDPQTLDEEDVEVSKSAEDRLTEGLDHHQESAKSESPCETKSEACKQDADVQKPKFWSLAETATSDIKKPNGMKHLPSQSTDFGKWWAGWPSRETYSPVNLSTHGLLKQK